MTGQITISIWLFLVLLAVTVWAVLDRVLIPSTRWFLRRRINRVIDEISMVRADLLDGVDSVLRRFRRSQRPFGGVQLLMIGDLFQLPPVVKENDWRLLEPYYASPYFFSSSALNQAETVTIELQHIYRQADSRFIKLLNRVFI